MSLKEKCLVKTDFPIFTAHPDLVYLDSAATTHKPQVVIDAISHFYSTDYATVNRAVYAGAAHATDLYSQARENVAQWVGARLEEIVFTSGTTESINLVAHGVVQKGDEVIISAMEHHSNIVPWQLMCQERGAVLKVIPIKEGQLDLEAFQEMLTPKTRIVAVAHISNVTGIRHPIEQMIAMAHAAGALILIDGAQAAAHEKLNLTEIGADFYAFSGHKMYGPTGIGVLYGKDLDALAPFMGGGDMIEEVTFENTTFQRAPLKFEAGTPKIAQVIGLSAAVDYLKGQEMAFQKTVANTLKAELEQIKRICILGAGDSLVTFTVDGAHPLDVATLLDFSHIALRSGHLCAQPLMAHFGLTSALRASVGIYTDLHDIDRFIQALKAVLNSI